MTNMWDLAKEAIADGRSRSSFAQEAEAAYDAACDDAERHAYASHAERDAALMSVYRKLGIDHLYPEKQ